jgi:hypothetical protein
LPAGRPSKYTPELLEKAQEYADGVWERNGNPVPSVVGLALHLGIAKSTCFQWAIDEGKEQFSDIVRQVEQKQEEILVSKGLTGDFTSPITKLMLTKHGYSDRQEISGPNGGAIETKSKLDVSKLSDAALKEIADLGDPQE